jgi:hypothetical protein
MKTVSARAQQNATLVRDLFSEGVANDTVRKILEARRTSAPTFVAHDGRVISTARIVAKEHHRRPPHPIDLALATLQFVVARLISTPRQ